jgi:hypothetical protein
MGMRTFLVLLIAGGLGVLFYHQKHQTPAAAEVKTVANSPATQPSKPGQPAEPRPVSEHNWMKRSLDRATEVRDQARTQTQQSQNP